MVVPIEGYGGGVTSRMSDILRQSQKLRERSRDVLPPKQQIDLSQSGLPISNNPDISPLRGRSPPAGLRTASYSNARTPTALMVEPHLMSHDKLAVSLGELVKFHRKTVNDFSDKIISLESELHTARNGVQECEDEHSKLLRQLQQITEQVRTGSLTPSYNFIDNNTETKISELESQINRQCEELRAGDQLQHELHNAITTKDQLITSLKEQLALRPSEIERDSIADLHKHIERKDVQYVDLQRAFSERTDQYNDSMNRIKDLKNEIKQLKEMKSADKIETLARLERLEMQAASPPVASVIEVQPFRDGFDQGSVSVMSVDRLSQKGDSEPPVPVIAKPEMVLSDLQVMTMPTFRIQRSCSLSKLNFISTSEFSSIVRRALNSIVAVESVDQSSQAPSLFANTVTVTTGTPSASVDKEVILYITDKALYVLSSTGQVYRCVPLDSVRSLIIGSNGNFGLNIPEQYDILVTGGKQLEKVLTAVVGCRRADAVTYTQGDISLMLALSPPKDWGTDPSDRRLIPIPVVIAKSMRQTVEEEVQSQLSPTAQGSPKPRITDHTIDAEAEKEEPVPPQHATAAETSSSTKIIPGGRQSTSGHSHVQDNIKKDNIEEPPPPLPTSQLTHDDGYEKDAEESAEKRGCTVALFRENDTPYIRNIWYNEDFSVPNFTIDLASFLSSELETLIDPARYNLHLAPQKLNKSKMKKSTAKQIFSSESDLTAYEISMKDMLVSMNRDHRHSPIFGLVNIDLFDSVSVPPQEQTASATVALLRPKLQPHCSKIFNLDQKYTIPNFVVDVTQQVSQTLNTEIVPSDYSLHIVPVAITTKQINSLPPPQYLSRDTYVSKSKSRTFKELFAKKGISADNLVLALVHNSIELPGR